jgi:hypothetical protein
LEIGNQKLEIAYRLPNSDLAEQKVDESEKEIWGLEMEDVREFPVSSFQFSIL